jgi:monoamine oxidase
MKSKQKKIIIIGAGIAGLAACKRLREHGYHATILEARGRAGGRIWTNDLLGIPLGGGATFIHGIDGNPITQLAQQFHTDILPMHYDKFLRYDRHGQLISNEKVEAFNQKFDALLVQAKMLANQAGQDMSLAEALSKVSDFQDLSPIETDLLQFRLRYFEGYIGASYQFLSARHWDQEEAWPGENGFLANSYQPIVDGLAKDCHIQFDTVVTKISKHEHNIEIETNNGLFYADVVLVTLPLGVLKNESVVFDPPLPAAKQKAIEHLGMGLLNIMGIRFPQLFWPGDADALIFSQFDELSVPIFFNLYSFIKKPILLGLYGGERAKKIENFSDKEIIQKTMQNLRQHFGAEIPDPEAFFISRWFNDPFSYGSYSYLATGATSEDYKALAQPVSDWLFFAGEATSEKHLATTHGAYLSGIREADRIALL